jgi:hypothetical protein
MIGTDVFKDCYHLVVAVLPRSCNIICEYYFVFKDFKQILDFIQVKFNYKELSKHIKIKIPGKYIVTRKVKDSYGDIVTKNQIVTIDDKTYNKYGTITYNFYYGVYGFHEGCTKIDCIRKPNQKENLSIEKNEFWKLPQEFNQSGF